MAADDSGRFEIESDARSHFAWLRTRLALERTLMAWLRTATSLIAFGFTIFQFFEWLRKSDENATAAQSAAPRYIGIVLLAAGIATLALAAWQYQKMVRYLWGQQFSRLAGIEKVPMYSATFAIAAVMIVVGIVALATVLFGLP
jgi:putative membrane protein